MLKSTSTWKTTPPPVAPVVTNISCDQSSRFPLNFYWGGGFSISPSTDFSHFDVGLIQISGQIQISSKSWPEFQQNLISGKNRRWQWQKWKGNEPRNRTWLNQHTGLMALIHLCKRSPMKESKGNGGRGVGVVGWGRDVWDPVAVSEFAPTDPISSLCRTFPISSLVLVRGVRAFKYRETWTFHIV